MADPRDDDLAQLKQRLERLIDEMSKPLPLLQRLRGWHEGNGGWTEETRERWREYFVELRARLDKPSSSFHQEAHHQLRAMDHDGIVGGRWRREAAEIQEGLWRLERARRRGRRR
jgi:hypothetical protein